MKILVTGCAGYIGGTFCYEALKKGLEVIGIDNFSNSNDKFINYFLKNYSNNFNFIESDIRNRLQMNEIFNFSGKPKEILDKIIDGKVKKFISEITLLKQNWILDPSKTVSQILLDFNDSNKSNFKIIDYKLFVLGEGVETVHKDFKEEVASQLADSQ